MTRKKKNELDKVKIIALGGASEIGKNMWAFEYEDEILVVDCGLMFPDEEKLGVDIVIPDISYLLENADKVKGIILTHGHEDHIGAIPYVLRQINLPIWGARLTLGFLQGKLEEHKLDDIAVLHEIEPGDSVQIGKFNLETIRISHSIPDGFAIAIRLPFGTIVHSGDFKFDQTPIDGKVADFNKFSQLGEEGVLLLMVDTTNAEKPGYVPSERMVGDMFAEVFSQATGKILIAAFASNIHRVQQIFDAAERFDKKVAIVGRSMVQNIEVAERLEYLKIPEGVRVRLDEIKDLKPSEAVIVTTGSQGKPLSALTRIATDDHKYVKIEPGDTVIISASPIPGNEALVMRMINHLFKRGANVLYDAVASVHVSGHANREEIKLLLNLTKPKYTMPIHGEARHVAQFAKLAAETGTSDDYVIRMEVGDVLELDANGARKLQRVQAGDVLVDGIGVGDVGDIVLRDRRHLADDGIFVVVVGIDTNTGDIVAGPDVISRGFIFMDEAEELVEEAKKVVVETIYNLSDEIAGEWSTAKQDVRSAVNKLLYSKTHRRPMVIPLIMEI
jgi:ribonuclease J